MPSRFQWSNLVKFTTIIICAAGVIGSLAVAEYRLREVEEVSKKQGAAIAVMEKEIRRVEWELGYK